MKRVLEDGSAGPSAKLPRIEEEPGFMLGRLRFEGRPKDAPPLVLMDPTRPERAIFTFHFLIGLTEPVQVCLERTGLVKAPEKTHAPMPLRVSDEDADKDMESDYIPPPPLPEEFSDDDGSAGSFSSSSHSDESSSDADVSREESRSSGIDEEDALAAADVDAGDSGHDDHVLFSVYATSPTEREQLAAFIARYQPSPEGFVNALLAALLYLTGADDPLLVARFAAEFPLLPETPVAELKLMAGMHHTIEFANASMTILRAGIAEEEEDSL